VATHGRAILQWAGVAHVGSDIPVGGGDLISERSGRNIARSACSFREGFVFQGETSEIATGPHRGVIVGWVSPRERASVSGDVRWKKVVVESAAVIAAILLAFGIDATWDAWGERSAEREAMDALYAEMLDNREELARVIRFNDEASEYFTTFLSMTPEQVASTEGDRRAVDALWAPYTFDPEVGALELFLKRAVSSSEAGRLVRRSAVNWQALLSDADEESRVLWDTAREVLGLMAVYSLDQVPEDGSEPSIYTILGDYGPRMSRLRTDEEFLAGSRAKFTLQQIYKGELGNLLSQTDTLLQLLKPSGP
jgi:hypothetical protein